MVVSVTPALLCIVISWDVDLLHTSHQIPALTPPPGAGRTKMRPTAEGVLMMVRNASAVVSVVLPVVVVM